MKNLLFILLIISTSAFSSFKEYQKEWTCFEKTYMGDNTCRMMVPKGWLVYTKKGYGATMVFLPDENHDWVL